jgi:hypothetical protein
MLPPLPTWRWRWLLVDTDSPTRFRQCCGQCRRRFGDTGRLKFWLEYGGGSLVIPILRLVRYNVCMLTMSPTFRRYTLPLRTWAYRWITVDVEYYLKFLHGVDVGGVTDVSVGHAASTFNFVMGMAHCWYWLCSWIFTTSRHSAVGIATGYGLDDRGVGVRVHVVQTGSGVHPTSYPMCTGGSFPGGKAAEAWSRPLISS